ncbi:MAG: hypothetical protein GY870_00955 [archaeon]|nr:hypothetical protein [archaeon]
MEFEKLQRFLKGRHKFDKKKDADEIISELVKLTNIMKPAIRDGNSDILGEHIGNYIVELIKVCNDFEIDLETTFKDRLKFSI